MLIRMNKKENRKAFRSECFITGRSRGTSQRYTVARTRIKHLSATAQLFGIRKAG
jgi:ribosomal protein S14